MTSVGDIALLRALLLGMEKDLGLDTMSSVQKDIVYAVTMILESKDTVETDEIRNHSLLAGVPRSSFFRALKEVIDTGHIKHMDGALRSYYKLADK